MWIAAQIIKNSGWLEALRVILLAKLYSLHLHLWAQMLSAIWKPNDLQDNFWICNIIKIWLVPIKMINILQFDRWDFNKLGSQDLWYSAVCSYGCHKSQDTFLLLGLSSGLPLQQEIYQHKFCSARYYIFWTMPASLVTILSVLPRSHYISSPLAFIASVKYAQVFYSVISSSLDCAFSTRSMQAGLLIPQVSGDALSNHHGQHNISFPVLFYYIALLLYFILHQFSSVQSLSHVWLFATLWTAEHQALSITNSRSPPKPLSIELVMPFNHLILCRPLLLLPPSLRASGSFPMSQFFLSGGQSIGVSASTSVLPINTKDWFPLEWTGWISLQSKGLSRVFSNTTVQKHQFFSTQLSV